jgi:TPR repeat protein
MMLPRTRRFFVMVGLALSAPAILLAPRPALAGANPMPAVPMVARALAVVIVDRTDLENRRFTSTGFVIGSDSRRSYLLTAYHVLCDANEENCLTKASSMPGLRCSAAPLAARPSSDQLLTVRLHTDPTTPVAACVENFGSLDIDNDLLLLRIDRPNLQRLSIARTVSLGWPVAAAGYPAGVLAQEHYEPGPPEVPPGTVTWVNTDDPNSVAPSQLRDGVQTSEGDSGGPLFDVNMGTVVGVVSRQSVVNGRAEMAFLAVGPASIILICSIPEVHPLIQLANLDLTPSAGSVSAAPRALTPSDQPTTQTTQLQSAPAGLIIPPPSAAIGSRYALASGSDPASEYQSALYYDDTGDEASAFTDVRNAATAGYAPAQAMLGQAYFYGAGVAPDLGLAFHWFSVAAAAGDYNGQRQLGDWFLDNNQDNEARTWYGIAHSSMERAAAGGDARAQLWLGRFAGTDAYGLTPDPAASLKWLQQASDKESDALVEIGWAHFYGRGVPQNTQLAIDWFARAVAKGNTSGAFAIAYACSHDPTAKPDYHCAVQWDQTVADRNGRAANELGWFYEFGRGVPVDFAQALKWYKRAVALGNTDAYDNIGNLYYYGRGVSSDYGQARVWFDRGAAYGDDRAEYDLGELYDDGLGVAQSDEDAVYWYKLAVDQGNKSAMSALGDIYYAQAGYAERHNRPADAQALFAKAIPLFKQAADLGDAYAQYSLGFMYAAGQGVGSRDYAQALKWLTASADQGNRSAEYKLGELYEKGHGVPRDLNRAYELYVKSADAGHAAAENRVGEAYARLHAWASGFSLVPKDYKTALGWFNLAAEQGDADGLANLGYLYLRGYGVSQDYLRAGAYLKLAEDVDTPYRSSQAAVVKQEYHEALAHATESQIKSFAIAWAKPRKVYNHL